MVADVNYETQNDAAYHARANYGSPTQVRNGRKIEILGKNKNGLGTMLGNTKRVETTICCKQAGVLRSVPDSLVTFSLQAYPCFDTSIDKIFVSYTSFHKNWPPSVLSRPRCVCHTVAAMF